MGTRGFFRLSCVLLLGTCALAAIRPAQADTTDDLLDKLLAKGILTQQEYDALKKRKATEAPSPAPAPAAAANASTPGNVGTYVTMMDKGVGVHVGPVDVSLSGEVNGFYVYNDPAKATANHVIFGGLAAVSSTPNSAVRNGLLPNNFNLDMKTVQDGWDIGVHLGIYPGINSVTGAGGANSAGQPTALATSGIDFRQQYLTVGRDDLGTLKVGRDIGLFGQEAILNDFTLFGVGSTGGNIAPSNTSLGRIGLGYIYADFMPQITYTTPSFSGLQAAVGIFQPLQEIGTVTLSANESPMVQGKLSYTSPDIYGFKYQLWTNFVAQQLANSRSAGDTFTNKDLMGIGGDGGIKLDYRGAELIGYGYLGQAIGTTGLFWNAIGSNGHVRDSDGYYVQGSYTFLGTFLDKVTLSGSYGLSHLDLASGEIAPLLVSDNESYAFGAKYKLTSWVNLIAEFTHTTATSHDGDQAEDDTVAAGAIAFF